MLVQNQSQLGEGLAIPTDPHHTPTIIPSSTQPQRTQQPRKPKGKNTQVPQPSDPIENVPNKAVHKELGDSLVRTATTASSLEAEHDDGEEVFIAKHKVVVKGVNDKVNVVEEVVEVINTTKLIINAAQDSATGDIVSTASAATTVSAATTTTATITTVGDITFAQALKEIKSTKPKEKCIVIQELGKSTTIKSSQQSHDKGKRISIEPVIEFVKPMKRKDQIRFDEETALKLQAVFDEEERLTEKAKKIKEANISLIETWDDILEKRWMLIINWLKEYKHKNTKSCLL
nr:hypothetical protein [Tanacetum cinerariifolium]